MSRKQPPTLNVLNMDLIKKNEPKKIYVLPSKLQAVAVVLKNQYAPDPAKKAAEDAAKKAAEEAAKKAAEQAAKKAAEEAAKKEAYDKLKHAQKLRQQQLERLMKLKSNNEVKEQVKKWSQQRQLLEKKRQAQYEEFQRKLQAEAEKQQKQRKQRAERSLQTKKEKLQKSIQQIQKRKERRSQSLNNLHKSQAKQKKQPLYKQKQKQFMQKQLQQQRKIRAQIIKKKQQMMIDMQEIRQHERQLMSQIKERAEKNPHLKNSMVKTHDDEQSLKNGRGSKSERSHSIHKSQFFVVGDPNRIDKEREKAKKRRQFQEKIKKIPITVSQQKMRQVLIATDKAKNPLKYNYLSNVAALSDQKIFDEFKDFQINVDRKQLGNDYFRQVKQQIQKSRIRSQSQSQLRKAEISDRPEYKNYLPEVKSLLKRRQHNNKTPSNEVEEVLYRYQTNSERLQALNKRSQYYQSEALKKIRAIKEVNSAVPYTDYLSKQQAIDDLYMRSIKMKIASAEIV